MKNLILLVIGSTFLISCSNVKYEEPKHESRIERGEGPFPKDYTFEVECLVGGKFTAIPFNTNYLYWESNSSMRFKLPNNTIKVVNTGNSCVVEYKTNIGD